MKSDDLEELAKDIFEQDPRYIKRRESAWDRVRKERGPPSRYHPFTWAIAWMGIIAIAAVSITWIARRAESPDRRTSGANKSILEVYSRTQSAISTSVEIVRTRELPDLYVEIDSMELHRLFPNGIVIAQGDVSRAITF